MHTTAVDIEFDPAKALANQRKHKVSFAHAEQVLRDPFAVTIEDPDSEHEQRLITLGCTGAITGHPAWVARSKQRKGETRWR